MADFVTLLREKLPAFVRSTFTGGAVSVARGIGTAILGLFAGLGLGIGLAVATAMLFKTGTALTVSLYILLAAVNGLGLAIYGWWAGLRSGLRRAVRTNTVLKEIVDKALDVGGDDLPKMQKDLATRKQEIVDAMVGGVGKTPVIGGLAARFAQKSIDIVGHLPNRILEADLSDRAKAQESTVHLLVGGVDSLFRRPIRIAVWALILLDVFIGIVAAIL